MKLKRYTIGQVIVFLSIIISLYGCSVVTGVKENRVYPSWEERKTQILVWASSERTKVDEETFKNSEYWKQFYRKSIELRPDLDDFACFAYEMTKVTRIFEEGKITKEQFEDKQRQLTAILAEEEKRRAGLLSGIRIDADNEAALFMLRSKSLFISYVEDLRRQLSATAPQFSISQCASFGENIHCTAQNPSF